MALPRKLKNFNVFNDGVSHIGEVTEIVLPKLTRKMEAHRAGGMAGEVDADMGIEKLECEHTYGGLMRPLFAQFGIARVDGVLLRFAGAYQRDDTGEVDAVEVVMRGRHSEIDAGTSKSGDDTVFKVKSTLSYYKLTINGEDVIEIDMLNMVETVNGEDRMAAHRRAIGL